MNVKQYELTSYIGATDCASYIPEYIEFHLLQGFDHFVIVDYWSKDGLEDLIQPYIKDGLVDFIKPEKELYDNGSGMVMLQRVVDKYRHTTRWLFGTGMDEFIFCPSGEKVSSYLRNYENDIYAGLSVFWVMFNSGGQEKREKGLVTERFTKRQNTFSDVHMQQNDSHIVGTVKTIVRPDRIEKIYQPHTYVYKTGFFGVDENRQPISNPHVPYVSVNDIRINHYFTMSREEYKSKMSKGRTDLVGGESKPREMFFKDDQWNNYHKGEIIEDRTIFESGIVDIVKQRLVEKYGDCLEKVGL